jgi:membrane protease YdiL (CAAX protease family)
MDFIAINSSILMMLAGLVVAVPLIHRRPLMTLVASGDRVDWRRIARAALVWTVIGLIAAFVEHLLHPERYSLTFRAERFFAFAAVALLLTPLQAATEELVFRGYVMQGLGLVFKRPAVIAMLVQVRANVAPSRWATYFVIGWCWPGRVAR